MNTVWVFLSGHCKVTNLLALAIRGVWLRLPTGVKERRPPPPFPPPSSPFFSLPPPLLTPSEVLLFSPSAPCAGGTNLWQNLNRHTCVTPGYRPRSLWSPFLTDAAFCFPRTLCVRWGSPPRKKKYTRSPVGQWIGCSLLSASADVANCFTLGREFPAITGRETRWGWMARRGECLGSKQREAPMCGDRLWCL